MAVDLAIHLINKWQVNPGEKLYVGCGVRVIRPAGNLEAVDPVFMYSLIVSRSSR